MASSSFPRQDIPEKDKNKDWMKKHLDYAEGVLRNYGNVKTRMTRLFNGYNGVIVPESLAWLEKNYGEQNKARYISYRLGRTKIDLLQGEQLKRPLQTVVTTINSDAMSEKMANVDFMKGAMVARDVIMELKEKAGVDIMEGAEIPKDESDPIWERMSFKDKAEDVMQILADNQTKELDVKKKVSEAFKNCTITNYCYAKVERNEEGDVKLYNIDPRDAIFEAIEGDDYMEKSPIMGCRQVLPVHEVLRKYNLSKEDRDKLEAARLNPDDYVGADGLSKGYMSFINGELLCDVIHIEWKSVTPTYYKIAPKTVSQLILDPTETHLRLELDTIKYENNIEFHNKNVEKGLYKIETEWMEDEYEATRIGGIIDTNMRRTYFQKRNVDKPAYIMSSSYFGYIHGRVNGVTVSLQQMIENYENIYDIIQYQKMKEFARSKGRVLTIDRAGLGKNEKLSDVAYRMLNDGIVDYDSSAAGNAGARNLDPANMFKQFDLGLSETYQYLLTTEANIIAQLDQITGINENRMGITAASSTATAQQSNIANSRTITEALFYGFSGFVRRVMQGIVDSTAISWAFYKIEKGEQILGVDRFRFLQVTRDIGYKNYGVFIDDGTKYLEISEKIEKMMEFSLNAKEIRPMDALNVLLGETVAQKRAALESSWESIQRIAKEQNEADNQAAAAMQQQQLQTQLQIAQENREDMQNAKKEEIVLQGQVDQEVDNNQARNKMYENQMKATNEIINNQNVS